MPAEDLSGEGFRHVHDFYTASPASVTTAASVPVLWDRKNRCIVSNDSGDIATMLNSEFAAFARCRGILERGHCSLLVFYVGQTRQTLCELQVHCLRHVPHKQLREASW